MGLYIVGPNEVKRESYVLYVKVKNRNIHKNIYKYIQSSKIEKYIIVPQVLTIKICQYILWIAIRKNVMWIFLLKIYLKVPKTFSYIYKTDKLIIKIWDTYKYLYVYLGSINLIYRSACA